MDHNGHLADASAPVPFYVVKVVDTRLSYVVYGRSDAASAVRCLILISPDRHMYRLKPCLWMELVHGGHHYHDLCGLLAVWLENVVANRCSLSPEDASVQEEDAVVLEA